VSGPLDSHIYIDASNTDETICTDTQHIYLEVPDVAIHGDVVQTIYVETQAIVLPERVVVSGDTSAGNTTLLVTAARDIDPHICVSADATGAIVPASTTSKSPVIGITSGSVSHGAYATIITSGIFTDSSWTWVADNPLFVGDGGILTQTPPSTGYMHVVGYAVSPTTVVVGIQQPIRII
jgi:hypothetical protein